MKKLLWSIAAVGLMVTGCSKDEVEEHVTEGVSALATPVGGNAKSNNNGGTWNLHVWNEAYFNQGQGSLWAKRSGNPAKTPTVAASFTVRYEDSGDAVSGMFSRVGNSPNYRSAGNLFSFTPADDFSLLSLSISWNAADGTPQEESGSIFLYPSGRTVVQAPKVVRVNERGNGSLAVTLADDLAQTIAAVEYRSCSESIKLNKTHVNAVLGVSRWECTDKCVSREEGEICGQTDHFMIRVEQTYDSDFFDRGDFDARIISKSYSVVRSGDSGPVTFEESDDPVILGSKLTSTNRDGTFNLTLAVAELGDPLQTVRCTFGESDGPAPIGDTFQMQLVGEGEGNLRIYEAQGIRFNGNATGSEYGIFFQFGTGTRSTAGFAKQKAELL